MQTPDGEVQVSQLARCDAFVTCGRAVVPTSFKINSKAVRPQRDVPLHISGFGWGSDPEPRDVSRNGIRAVAVTFGTDGWYRTFGIALEVVDHVLDVLDGLRTPYSGWAVLIAGLIRDGDKTVAEVVDFLRHVPPELNELAAGVVAVQSVDTFPVAAYEDLLEGWKEDSALGRIVNGQGHIFGLVA